MNLVDIVVQLRNERDRIDEAITALDDASGDTNASAQKGSPTRKGGISAEGRRRLSAMMRKRWADKRKKTKAKS